MREHLYNLYLEHGLLLCYSDFVTLNIKFETNGWLSQDLLFDKANWTMDHDSNQLVLHGLGCTEKEFIGSILPSATNQTS